MAAGACDGTVIVWEVTTGLQRAALQCPEAAAVRAIMISPDARLLASAVDAASSCVHLFDLESASLLASSELRCNMQQLQWSADGCSLRDARCDQWSIP